MRIGLTIILNGKHHLEHRDYANRLLDMLDIWCVVEGASGNTGSTTWCKPIPAWAHKDGRSTDGTVEALEALATKHSKLLFVKGQGLWANKDAQINAGIEAIRQRAQEGFLWQIDCDEQWTAADMQQAEAGLTARRAKMGYFLANYYVGKNLVARGDWGEGRAMPYNRLWCWHGERFASHEPPQLVGGNGVSVMLPQRFEHFAYYFEQDVKFKDAWYGGHEGIHAKWLALQKAADNGGTFPVPISSLISGHFGKTKTQIFKV